MKKQDKPNTVSEGNELWDGITEEDFIEADNDEDIDAPEYDKEKMRIFIANINLARQIPRFMDGLKPVERRILCTVYGMKAFPNTPNKKSNKIIGATGELHPHGDTAIYESIASMIQYWKRQVPLLDGKGENFGSTEDSTPAHPRYTGATLSGYSYECFFEEYDEDCIEMIFNEGAGESEPAALPAKFPNILLNGVFALAMGNLIYIPPYNVEDIMNLSRKLLKNPNYSDCYIVPDFPTGCDIVDNGSWKQICDEGEGRLIMQSIITVESGTCVQGRKKTPAWGLHVRNLPWLVELKSFEDKLASLIKNKEISIIDAQNERKQLRRGMKSDIVIDYCVYIDKSHDPYEVREKLWSRCGLRKTLPVNFKAVEEGYSLSERLNIRSLLLSWIDTRREYKRRIYNKKLGELKARNDFLQVFVEITGTDKLEKTLNIIRNSSTSDARNQLMLLTEMTSFQADKLLGMRVSSFTKDMREKYIEELKKNAESILHYSELIRSPKKIDAIIDLELQELRKYRSDRKSQLVALGGRVIPNTLHSIIVTKMGYVKKFLIEKIKTNIQIGAMKNGDFPAHYIGIKNLDSLLVLDDSGRMTNIPVHEIPSTDPNQIGTDAFSLFRLNGSIIKLLPWVSEDNEYALSDELESELFLITLSENGYIKKTPLRDMRSSFRNKPAKSVRITGLKEYDRLVYGNILSDDTNVLVYTLHGRFKSVEFKSIPTMSKSSQGLSCIKIDEDKCAGLVSISTTTEDSYLVVVTSQGCMKKLSMNHIRIHGNRKDDSMILTSLDPGDSVYSVGIANKGVTVTTKSGSTCFSIDEIPELGTRAKCKKIISLSRSNLLSVSYE